MGGFGSGNWQRPRKGHVDEYPSIDIRRWYREFLMLPSRTFRLTLSTTGNTPQDINVYPWFDHVVITHVNNSACEVSPCAEEIIAIDCTICNFGGQRQWFVCPASNCRKRAAILYLATEGFRCRRCAKLAYLSQYENGAVRAIRKLKKLMNKLGAPSSTISSLPTKPARMHGSRYLELVHAAIDAQARSWREIEAGKERWRQAIQKLRHAALTTSQTNY